jgi:cytochrome c oxidase cbb3-type subunit 4
MTYDIAARIAQQAGTVYFVVLFLAGCAYAVWPRNGEAFRHAARLPLEEEETL